MTTLPSLMALRCFDASARHESFTKAATEIHLTQGAVSHQVLGLEAHLGVSLFVRRRAGLRLTSVGSAYLAEVSTALRQLERATQNVVTHKGAGGALNLCVASSFATYWLIPRLSGFVAAHPEVTLNLSTHIGPVDFSSAPHDAAIEFCSGATAGLRAELVLPLSLRPYVAPRLLKNPPSGKGPQALKKVLMTYPLIRHTTVPHAWASWLAQADLLDLLPAQRLDAGPQYDLLSMALNGVIAGLGVALLPEYVASGAVASGQVRQLSSRSWKAEKAYYLRYPEWKSEMMVLQRFQQWLQSA